MGTITVSIDDETEEVFRGMVGETYGKGKGHLGKAITEAIQEWVHERQQKQIAERELKRIEKGYDTEVILYKTRDELWVR